MSGSPSARAVDGDFRSAAKPRSRLSVIRGKWKRCGRRMSEPRTAMAKGCAPLSGIIATLPASWTQISAGCENHWS